MHSTSAYLSHIRFTLFFVHTKLLLFLVKYSSFFFSGMLYKVLKSLVSVQLLRESLMKEDKLLVRILDTR